MKTTPRRHSLAGRLTAVLLAVAMLLTAMGSFAIWADTEAKVKVNVSISGDELAEWIATAGSDGVKMDTGQLGKIGDGAADAAWLEAVQTQIDKAGILLHQKSLPNNCMLYVAGPAGGIESMDQLTLIAVNTNAEKSCDFTFRMEGKKLYPYQATMTPYTGEAPEILLEEDFLEDMPDEMISNDLMLEEPVTDNASSQETISSETEGETPSAGTSSEKTDSSQPTSGTGTSSEESIDKSTDEPVTTPEEKSETVPEEKSESVPENKPDSAPVETPAPQPQEPAANDSEPVVVTEPDPTVLSRARPAQIVVLQEGEENSQSSEASSENTPSTGTTDTDTGTAGSASSDAGSSKVDPPSAANPDTDTPSTEPPNTTTPNVGTPNAETPKRGTANSNDKQTHQVWGITQGESVELNEDELAKLRSDGYHVRLPDAGIAVLEMSLNQGGSPFDLADSILGKDAAEPAASVTVEASKTEVKTGEPFYYTVTYNVKSIPGYNYSDSSVLPLFDAYENTRIEVRLPKGVTLLKSLANPVPDEDALKDGVYVYEVGKLSSARRDSFQITVRMDGNGQVPNGTSYPTADETVGARILADVAVKNETGVGESSRDYKMDFAALGSDSTPAFPVVKNVADDVWMLEKTLIEPSNGKKFTIEKGQNGQEDQIVLNYKIAVGLSTNGTDTGKPGGDNAYYQKYGRLNFDSYQLTDHLPTFERQGVTYKPLSSEIRFAGEKETLAVGKKDQTELTISAENGTVYKTQTIDSYIENGPSYTEYEVTVRYSKNALTRDFDDPDQSAIILNNKAQLTYRLVGQTDPVQRNGEASVEVLNVNEASVLRIRKYIGTDSDKGSSPMPYDTSAEEEFPGYAAFTIEKLKADKTVDTSMGSKTVYVNPKAEAGEPPAAVATGDYGYVDVPLVPGTYRVTETAVPKYSSFPTTKFYDVTIPELVVGGDNKPVEVSFYNPIQGKGFIYFAKTGISKPGQTTADAVALEGVTFGLFKDKACTGEPIAKAVSDVNGNVRFTAPTGNYYVKELSTTLNYLLDKTVYEASIEDGKILGLKGSGGANVDTLVNYANSVKLTVTKSVLTYDADGKQTETAIPTAERSGFEFTVQQSTDGKTWVGAEGTTTYKLPAAGASEFTLTVKAQDAAGNPLQYRIVETKKPDQYSYAEGKDQYTLVLNASDSPELAPCSEAAVKIVNTRKGQLQMEKYQVSRNADGTLKEEKPAGVAFKLYRMNTTGKLELVSGTDLLTDPSGKITADGLDVLDSNKKPYEYYWQEVTVPEGYRLAGAVSGLTDTNGVAVNNAVKAGAAVISASTVLRVDNISTKTIAKIEKRDGDSQKLLSGAEFKLEKKVGTGDEASNWQAVAGVAPWTSTEQAMVLTLEPGEYRVTETKAPAGYSLFQIGGYSYQSFKIESWETAEAFKNAEPKTITFHNFKLPSLVVSKNVYSYNNYQSVTDRNDRADYLSMTFELYRKNGEALEKVSLPASGDGAPVSSWTVEAGKTISIDGLSSGEYYVKEIGLSTAADGRTLLPEQILEAYKDNSGKLQGVVERNGSHYFGPVTLTDRKGTGDNKSQSLIAKDFQNRTALKLVKQSAQASGNTKAKLPGAVFRVHGTVGETVVDLSQTVALNGSVKKDGSDILATTGANGEIIVDKLPIYYKSADGVYTKITYTVTEETAPSGYAKSTDKKTISNLTSIIHMPVTNGKPANYSFEEDKNQLTFENEPYAALTVRKVGRDLWAYDFIKDNVQDQSKDAYSDIRLPGVELALYQVVGDKAELVKNEKGEAVVLTTNQFGEATFENLSNKGKYYVVEVASPDGYALPDGKIGLVKDAANALPATLTVADLEKDLGEVGKKGLYNSLLFDFGNPSVAVDSAAPKADLTKTPLVNEKGWAKFRIEKKEADADGKAIEKFVDGAQFVLHSIPADQVGTLTGLDWNAAATRVGKDYYESGAALNESAVREPGVVYTDKMSYGNIYWLVETAAPGGYLESELTAILLLPEGMTLSPEVQNALSTKKVEVRFYTKNADTTVSFVNKVNPDGGAGEPGATPYVYVALKKVVYDTQATMNEDSDAATKGTPLGGVTFGLWLLNKQGTPMVRLDTLTTGLDYKTSKIPNQAISNRVDLSKYYTEDATAPYAAANVVKNKDGTYTAKLRLVEESAPAGVVLQKQPEDFFVTSGTLSTEGKDTANYSGDVYQKFFKAPIKNYRVNGYSLTIEKYGYTRKNGLNYAAASETEKKAMDESQWLASKLSNNERTPLAGVKFDLYKEGVTKAIATNLSTDVQGRISYPNTSSGSSATLQGLEPGRYRLVETGNGVTSGAKSYENTYSGGYYFDITNANKSIQLFNPEKPQVKIVKNGRTSFSETGNPLMQGKSFYISNVAGAVKIDVTGSALTYLDRGTHTIYEAPLPTSVKYTHLYPVFTYADGKPLTASTEFSSTRHYSFEAGWGTTQATKNIWPENNTVVIHVQDAQLGDLLIRKTDDQGKPLAGVAFKIYLKQDFREIDFNGDVLKTGLTAPSAGVYDPEKDGFSIGTTDANGEILLQGLEPGWYTIGEASAPEFYAMDPKPQVIAVKGDLTVLARKETPTVAEPTDKNGEATFVNVPYDTLQVTKTFVKPSAKTIQDAEVAVPGTVNFDVYVKNADQTVASMKSGTIPVTITNAASGEAVGSSTLRLPRLENGQSYVLKEVTTGLENWMLDSTKTKLDDKGYIQATYDTGSRQYTFTATNVYAGVQAKLLKSDSKQASSVLQGAVFEVYYYPAGKEQTEANRVYIMDGGNRYTFTSGDNGVVNIAFLLPEALRNNDALTTGITFHAVETKAPDGYVLGKTDVSFTLKPGVGVDYTTNAALNVKNDQGAKVNLIKYNNIYGKTNAEPLNGVKFALYRLTANNQAVLVEELTTAPNGTLLFNHLPVGNGEQYALYEYVDTAKFVKLESVHSISGVGNTVQPTALPTEERTLADGSKRLLTLLPAGFAAGETYAFSAYNLPKQALTIEKRNAVSGGDVPTADFSIWKLDASGNKVGDAPVQKVTTSRTGVTGYSKADVTLEPGRYLVEETKSSLQLNKNDLRYEYQQTVEVKDGETTQTVTFLNTKSIPDVSLSKTANPKALEKSLFEAEATINYTLSKLGGNGNGLPLDSYVVTDEGLSYYSTTDFQKTEKLPDEEYVKNKYTITELHIGPASYQNYLANNGGSKDGKVGKVSVVITMIGFDGATNVSQPMSVEKALTYTVPDGKWKGFTVQYADAALATGTAPYQYDLGQNFIAGDITVTMKLDKQAQGKTVIPVRGVVNTAKVDLVYRAPSGTGVLPETGTPRTLSATDKTTLPDPAGLPPVKVTKTDSFNGGMVRIGDKVEYTITLKNSAAKDSGLNMKDPVLVDLLPQGVEVLEKAYNGKSQYSITLPQGSNLKQNTAKVGSASKDGKDYLAVWFSGDLKPDEEIVVKYQVTVQSAVLLYGQTMTNQVQATSLVKGIVTTKNPEGISFKAEGGTSGSNANQGSEVVSGLFFDDATYYYVGAERTNTVEKQNSLVLLKRVTANKETGSHEINGTTPSLSDVYVPSVQNARASVGADGFVDYQLTVFNGGTQTHNKLRLLDMLPNLNDVSLDGNARYSKWVPTFDQILKVEKYDKDNKKVAEADLSYEMYYTTQMIGSSGLSTARTMMLDTAVPAGAWSTTKPAAESIKGLVLNFNENLSLATGERLIVTMKMKVPAYSDTDDVYDKLAINTFSVSSIAGANVKREYLVSNFVKAILEPENVGVGGHIWIDKNDNGKQDDEQLATDGLPQGVKVKLLTYQGTSASPITSRTMTTDANGKFRFDKLSPSAVDSKTTVDQAYDAQNNLLPEKLRGNQTSYKLVITPPEGFALAKSYSYGNGLQTRSTNPVDLMESAEKAKSVPEAMDSNFVEQDGSYVSEQFYLWPGSLWDLTKDLGLVRIRDLEIEKRDAVNQPLEGVDFALYGPYDTKPTAIGADEKPLQTGTTDATGKLRFNDILYYGYYLVVETKTVEGYTLDGAQGSGKLLEKATFGSQPTWILNAATAADLTEGTQKLVNALRVTNSYATGPLTVSKRDTTSGKPLAGAQFRLTGKSTMAGLWEAYLAGVQTADVVTGATGVHVSEGGLLFTTTGADTAVIGGLPFGSYQLQEIQAPDGYRMDGKTINFAITTANGYALTGDQAVQNSRVTGTLSFEKADAENPEKKLAGAQFTLGLSGSDSVVKGFWAEYGAAYVKTNANAKWANNLLTLTVGAEGLTLEGLPAAGYTLTEIVPPAGYQANATAWSKNFTISAETPNAAFTGENAILNAPVKYTLKKVDAESRKPLANVSFAVQSANGKVDLLKLTTNEEGVAFFTASNLEVGTEYLLTELAAPSGYLKANPVPFRLTENGVLAAVEQTPAEVVIAQDGLTVIVPNQMIKGSLTVKKVVDGVNPLPDTKFNFRLTGLDDNGAYQQTIQLAAGQEYTFANLTLGKYQLEELADASFDFVRFEGVADGVSALLVDLTESNTQIVATAHNKIKAAGKLTIEKQVRGASNENDQFTFQLYRSANGGESWAAEGNSIQLKAGETHTFENLQIGTEYRVEETKVGTDYRLTGIDAVRNGTVDLEKNSYLFTPAPEQIEGKARFINERILGSLDILKYRSGSPEIHVDGATFELYRYNEQAANFRGEKLATGTTANGGQLQFNNLPSGRYVLLETYAPRNYYVLKAQYTVELRLNEARDGLMTVLPTNEKVATLVDGQLQIPNSYGPPRNQGTIDFGNNNFFEDLVDILEDPTPLANFPEDPNQLTDLLDDPIPLANLPKLPTTGGFPVFLLGGAGLILVVTGLFLRRGSKKSDTTAE